MSCDDPYNDAVGLLTVLDALASAKACEEHADFWYGISDILRQVLKKLEAMHHEHVADANRLYALDHPEYARFNAAANAGVQ
jgi:hypothetical protein